MAATGTAESLSPDQASRLTDFARACKAAARVVALYPATHPAIQASLTRVTDSATRLCAGGIATLTILPDGILLDGRGALKPDGALAELASLLHTHLIGEMKVLGDLPPTGWHSFLALVARTFEDVRAEGGIVRAWNAAGGGPIELRQIDYREVLRERRGPLEGDWDRIIANYLDGEWSDLDDQTMAALFDLMADSGRFKDFTERLVSRAVEAGSVKRDAVLGLLQALADFVARRHPDALNHTLDQIASVVPRLTPDLVVMLMTIGAPSSGLREAPQVDLPGEVRARLTDRTIAEFVARSVARARGATDRLAQAFHALAPTPDARAHLLDLAREDAEHLPIGQDEHFPDLWRSAAELLTSYSDADFVSEDYGRELAEARLQAVEVERVSDDPPERINSWISTVSEAEIRRLDGQVLLDLLTLETRPDAWQKILESALGLIEQLVLTRHVMLAQLLLDAVVAAARSRTALSAVARAGLDRLREGSLMHHVVLFARQAVDDDVKAIAGFCRTLGPDAIRPLAEALAVEQGGAVKRLGEIVLSFGAAGRQYADELRTSANPAVRRVAIELLRAFGGADALPDLAALMDDAEPGIQREAVRAIVQIGTKGASDTLQDALIAGSPSTGDAILSVLSTSNDERAAPLFVHILEHTEQRGRFDAISLVVIEALGRIGGDAPSVAALTRVLHRGQWWAPLRTRRLRSAAAAALGRSASPEARRALQHAVDNGPRGVRRSARAALQAFGPAPPRKLS